MNFRTKRQKKDIAKNYEINKVTRTILKPAGTVTRLSVAAVIDGKYELEKLKDGTTKREYIPRTEKELKKFEEIVKKAMGYNEDREDQVTVSSISFSDTMPMDNHMTPKPGKLDSVLSVAREYRRTIINLALIAMVFLFIVRPLLKSMKAVTKETLFATEELTRVSEEYAQIPESKGMDMKNRVREISQNNPEKAQQLIRGWIGEKE